MNVTNALFLDYFSYFNNKTSFNWSQTYSIYLFVQHIFKSLFEQLQDTKNYVRSERKYHVMAGRNICSNKRIN